MRVEIDGYWLLVKGDIWDSSFGILGDENQCGIVESHKEGGSE